MGRRPRNTTPSRNSSIWAPEIHFPDGHWYLYDSAEQSGTRAAYKSMITGANLYPTDWLIDASVLRVNGQSYPDDQPVHRSLGIRRYGHRTSATTPTNSGSTRSPPRQHAPTPPSA